VCYFVTLQDFDDVRRKLSGSGFQVVFDITTYRPGTYQHLACYLHCYAACYFLQDLNDVRRKLSGSGFQVVFDITTCRPRTL
jgi:ABC-type protease/lipase transport system fused ATPase/permease subunit